MKSDADEKTGQGSKRRHDDADDYEDDDNVDADDDDFVDPDFEEQVERVRGPYNVRSRRVTQGDALAAVLARDGCDATSFVEPTGKAVLCRLTGDRVSVITSAKVALFDVSKLLISIFNDNGIGSFFDNDAQAAFMGIRKRRLHDILAVFNAIGLTGRPMKNKTCWLGYESMQQFVRDRVAIVPLSQQCERIFLASTLAMEQLAIFATACVISGVFSIDDSSRTILKAVTTVVDTHPNRSLSADRRKAIMRRIYDVAGILAPIGKRHFDAVATPLPPAIVSGPSQHARLQEKKKAAEAAAAAVKKAKADLVDEKKRKEQEDRYAERQRRYNEKRRIKHAQDREKRKREKEQVDIRRQKHAEKIEKERQLKKQKQEEEEEDAKKKKEEEADPCNGKCKCCVLLRQLLSERQMTQQQLHKEEEEDSTASLKASLDNDVYPTMFLPPPPPPPTLSSVFLSFPGAVLDETMHGLDGMFA